MNDYKCRLCGESLEGPMKSVGAWYDHYKCVGCGQMHTVLGPAGSVAKFSGLGFCGSPKEHTEPNVYTKSVR